MFRLASPKLISKLISRVSRRTWRLLFRLSLLFLLIPLLFQLLLAYIVGKDARLLPSTLQQAQNLLIVTAHPDDECLFFAPSILGVLDGNEGIVGGLLVLSTGKTSLFLSRD
jgi:N-acetylglucosaminylphosphatidylinositol deacetylase